MTFDWQTFLDQHGFDYSDRGPSTAKGNIYLQCAFCGDADQGRHMGISLAGKGWGCWRDERHRGKAPARLIQALLGCDWKEALRLAGQEYQPLPGDLLSEVKRALGNHEEAPAPTPPAFPKGFKPLLNVYDGPHWRYMRDERGFSDVEIRWLADCFDLQACLTTPSDWAWRLIIPVYDEHERLVTWTGRAIAESRLRYRILTTDPGKALDGPLAVASINDGFLDIGSMMRGGEFLVLAEGPFDAFALSLFTSEFRAHADCLFTKTISPAQLDVLTHIRPRYRKVFLLLDPEERTSALRTGYQLQALQIEPWLLDGEADPAEMTPDEIVPMLAQMREKANA